MDIDVLKTKKDLTLDEIELLMKEETNVKVYKKLSYFRFKILGYSKLEAFELANIKKSTGYNIEDRWIEGGYYGLLDKKRKKSPGRKIKLNDKELNELSEIIKSKNDITIHDIQKIIENNWNISYTYSGVKNLLIKQFNVDITEYLDYNQKSPTNIVPDDKSLENMSEDDKNEFNLIISTLHEEKDVFVYKKLSSFIFQKLGYSLDIISNIIGVTEETLVTWNNQWKSDGYKGLLKKSGQGRKAKLSKEQLKDLRKILRTRNDWLLPEISFIIETKYGVKYSSAHLSKLLKEKLKMHFAKPYPRDYRQSPYYKQSFHLKLNPIFKKYQLKYDINTGNIINMATNEPFHIFSFDESSFQFTPNNVKFWALVKPMVERDSSIFKCKAMGAYALSPQSKDYLEFVDNQKSETVMKFFENLRKENPTGVILLLIDNYSSHKTDLVKEKAKELNIELCYLPTYSPQLQPIEKVWKANKREIASFKLNSVKDYKDLNKDERKEKLMKIIKTSFYNVVKSKNKWNKVSNNYIKRKIKLYSPEFNEDWEVQLV